MISAPFSQFSRWNGRDTIPASQKMILKKAIASAHENKKPVRFWGAPDTEDAWKEFIKLEVDYINTDRIHDLSEFLKTRN
jgi:alkaline phosphatase